MSMLSVAELIADPELGLQLVAGHAGAGREIEAAAVSELANPGPWLQSYCNACVGEKLPTRLLLCADGIPTLGYPHAGVAGLRDVARHLPMARPLFPTQGANP